MYLLILLPAFITIAGIYMLVKLRAFFILHPIKTLRCGIASLKKDGVLSSYCLALAGTLGVGNIFGVAMGIILGGAGSVFWLMLSSVFSSAIKYSEVLMTSQAREKKAGGMPAVIRMSFGRSGVLVSLIYSALCLVLAFVMGSSLQARSISGAVESGLGTSRIIIAPLIALCVLSLTRGGAVKIEKITRKLIPLSSIIYIFSAFFVIFLNFSRIPAVIFEIFSSAFSFKSMSAGVLSSAFLSSLREGYARGVMSNEAGVGTSSFAHSRAQGLTAHEYGVLGIFEVIFDTAFICGLTGLTILLGAPDYSGAESGMALVTAAFSPLGKYAVPVIVFCVFSFAVSSMLCWYFYGDECRKTIFGKRGGALYTTLFVLSGALGVFLPDGFSVRFTDIILLFMSLPTLIAIIKNSDRISRLSELDKYKFGNIAHRSRRLSKKTNFRKGNTAAQK